MIAWTPEDAAAHLDRLAALAAGAVEAHLHRAPGLVEGERYNLHERIRSLTSTAYTVARARLPQSDYGSLRSFRDTAERIADLEAVKRGLDRILAAPASAGAAAVEAEIAERRGEVEADLAAARDRLAVIRGGLASALARGER